MSQANVNLITWHNLKNNHSWLLITCGQWTPDLLGESPLHDVCCFCVLLQPEGHFKNWLQCQASKFWATDQAAAFDALGVRTGRPFLTFKKAHIYSTCLTLLPFSALAATFYLTVTSQTFSLVYGPAGKLSLQTCLSIKHAFKKKYFDHQEKRQLNWM